ncbi:UNG glycosylase, partial [Polypterus senegalus]
MHPTYGLTLSVSRCLSRYKILTPVKRRKVEENGTPISPPLSPEQLQRMEKNKRAALEKLASRGVPEGFGSSWKEELLPEFNKPYFTKVKVVILGQDPYHGPSQAHGLCFSVQRPVSPPPSLENMYKELESDIEGFKHPGHGDLTGWAKQGVLLLNAVLTVRAHQANSHKDRGWEQFTDAVIQWLNNNQEGLVFMLWGAYAQKKGSCIDRISKEPLKSYVSRRVNNMAQEPRREHCTEDSSEHTAVPSCSLMTLSECAECAAAPPLDGSVPLPGNALLSSSLWQSPISSCVDHPSDIQLVGDTYRVHSQASNRGKERLKFIIGSSEDNSSDEELTAPENVTSHSQSLARPTILLEQHPIPSTSSMCSQLRWEHILFLFANVYYLSDTFLSKKT